ncbi:magnesium-dependent phosphatase-1 [Laetiporus sulphureus 93-53]|uniref:Magnesium-dependent phosphatase-1 n=1 Tax=Laetiporus sulphureus 93-53 TaxID=1314785 RepID=A0A165BI90_9APHY|nr:magnesium-dependent phosphatase-1 [Laetiporus sulphureus 93-53]KZT01107.1 magnesium-dependent phosphatase-1 [Laetiporus sulphureus 93-53]
MTSRLPKLIAMDLDYTLWDLWIDTHITPPLRSDGKMLNCVRDRYNREIEFYHDVPDVLHRLREAGVIIATCSRTHAPDVARQALSMLLVPPKAGERHSSPTPAIKYFDQLEIYPGSKVKHFMKLHEKTGLPYSEMLFFDDEHRNSDVESLGVTFCLAANGLDERTFQHGLDTWRKKHLMKVIEDAADVTEEQS